MPREHNGQLIDDYDGEPLPEDTPETALDIDSVRYHLYLSAPNREKLLEVLQPFIADADAEGHTGRMNNMR